MALPLNPSKGSSDPQATPMGPTAFFSSGAVMFNPLSSPQGNLALDKEWISLDPCHGHSSPDNQYHYHAVSKIYFEEIILVGLGAIQIICAIQEGHYI